MHNTHHKLNHHSDNFGTVSLWDVVFGTVNIDDSPKFGNTSVGLSDFAGYTRIRGNNVRPDTDQWPARRHPDQRHARHYRHAEPDQRDETASSRKR